LKRGIRAAIGMTLCTLLLCALPANAHADSRAAEAAREFDRAAELFSRGDYQRAAQGFTRAFELSPHADSAYNAALSWEEANEPVRAAESYRDALHRGLSGDARDDAKARLGRLRASLGLLKVSAADAAAVRVGERTREAPAEFFVEPGSHLVVMIARDGRKRRRNVDVEAGAERELYFNREHANPDEPPPDRPQTAPEKSGIFTTLGWTGVATGGVLAVVAVFVGIKATDARDEFNASDRTDLAERDHALALRTWTRVAWVSAALVGGSGAAILLLADDSPSNTTPVAMPTGAAFRTTF
jgi:hypothetical protein